MFKKIVSQLSLSPSAVGQLTFYARRLKKEKVTRTFSALAAVLLVGLQFTVIAAPPTNVNAASSNDLIHGGVTSKDDLLNHYDSSPELRAVFDRFKITRADLRDTHEGSVNSKDGDVKSLSRHQHGGPGETEVHAYGESFFIRPLHDADTGSNVYNGSNYAVLEGTRSSNGTYFAVMHLCGNIVTRFIPAPPAPPTPKPTPKPTPRPTPAPTPKPAPLSLACVELIPNKTTGLYPLTVSYTGSGHATGQTITGYIFNYGDNTTATAPTPAASHTYAHAGKYVATMQVKGSAGKTTAVTPPCSATITVTSPPAAFNKAKSAINLTQNVDATTAPARADDLIKYHLTTKNVGGTAEAYTVVEHVEDILDYADVSDLAGGTISNGVITWPAQTIQPGATLTTEFTVKIKDPIPDTPVGASDPSSFDLTLDNIYGNLVEVKIAPPVPKQIEVAATQLPATGAPTATFIVLLVSGLSLFFYFRNRQLLAEVKLLRGEYQGGL